MRKQIYFTEEEKRLANCRGSQKYRLKNPECQREYKSENRDKVNLAQKIYRARTREATLEKRRLKRAGEPEEKKAKTRKYNREYRNERWATDPNFRLRKNLSSRILIAIKEKKGEKQTKTEVLLGAPISYVRLWIAAQFRDGMTWENYGDWHVDHIVPCAGFDLTSLVEQKRCFHYTNLQPLWALDNMRKGDRI